MAFNILRIVLQKACKMNNSFGPYMFYFDCNLERVSVF